LGGAFEGRTTGRGRAEGFGASCAGGSGVGFAVSDTLGNNQAGVGAGRGGASSCASVGAVNTCAHMGQRTLFPATLNGSFRTRLQSGHGKEKSMIAIRN
jgi:hypothetical protein